MFNDFVQNFKSGSIWFYIAHSILIKQQLHAFILPSIMISDSFGAEYIRGIFMTMTITLQNMS